ncbi:hypothetical protein Hypma_008622 [Hypsizygus marmoreus]|uniref:F-box domain-containing protein n=1 Tax=Hypsizygus marmoreus TaxID=39966 RepID=A0A369JUN2_HYPMA|nr:hypothetical protein Hypma_008622 [Hypsizygus marmoreus]
MLSLTQKFSQKVYQTFETEAKRLIWNPLHTTSDGDAPHKFDAEPTTPGTHNPNISKFESVPPIDRLPVEVLGEIFSWYLYEPAGYLFLYAEAASVKATMWSKFDPILLGHICMSWRVISLSMPMLWSSIAVFKPTSSQIPLIQVWLDRATHCSLSLTILQSKKPNLAEQKATDEVLLLFQTRAHLWRRLDIQIHQRRPNKPLQNLPATPMLESVQMRVNGWKQTVVDQVWRNIHLLPSLRRVGWCDVYMEKGMPAHAPWGQLTHINTVQGVFKALCVEEFLNALQQCQELVSFETSIIMPRDSPSRPLPDITLPKLRILKFAIRGGPTPSALFQHLTLPSLVSLAVHQSNWPPTHRLCWIKDLMRHSRCRLAMFFLWDPLLNEDELIDFLSSPEAQHLNRLDLLLQGLLTARTIKCLTYVEAEATNLLPDLEVLVLRDYCASDAELFEMITSRLPALKKVQLPAPNSCIPSRCSLSFEKLFLTVRCDFRLEWLH